MAAWTAAGHPSDLWLTRVQHLGLTGAMHTRRAGCCSGGSVGAAGARFDHQHECRRAHHLPPAPQLLQDLLKLLGKEAFAELGPSLICAAPMTGRYDRNSLDSCSALLAATLGGGTESCTVVHCHAFVSLLLTLAGRCAHLLKAAGHTSTAPVHCAANHARPGLAPTLPPSRSP